MGDLLAFWLIPTHETRRWFSERIHELAERYGTPAFEPHVTVHAGPKDAVASPASVIAERSLDCTALTLEASAIGYSSQFSKTLFLEFATSAELLALAAKLRERVPSDYVLSPHLSLLYHTAPETQLATIASQIVPPFRIVRFETIQAVECPQVTASADDVRSWRILEEWRLPDSEAFST
jgi:hypothetical protein